MNRPPGDILTLFQSLVEIVSRLRGPQGCPWDQEQTQSSLAQYAIEEAYELVEAIESGNQTEIQEELGDFLFQVLLQAQVAKDEGHFRLEDVIHTLSEKMIRRHPHVFSSTQLTSAEEVWQNWDKLKNKENATKVGKSALFGYPHKMPALQAAAKIGRKTETWKFDWARAEEVVEKIEEELQEVRDELSALLPDEVRSQSQTQNKERLESEIGDLLFSVAQLARFCRIDPEAALRKTNRRFEHRFEKVVERSGLAKEQFAELSAQEKEKIWNLVKRDEK